MGDSFKCSASGQVITFKVPDKDISAGSLHRFTIDHVRNPHAKQTHAINFRILINDNQTAEYGGFSFNEVI